MRTDAKINCPNYNHGKPNPAVAFCPNCGKRFSNPPSNRSQCNEETHRKERKNRASFCADCGKSLKY